MKVIIATVITILWFSICGGFLFLMSSLNTVKPVQFQTDNTGIRFSYSGNLQVEIQGDINSLAASKTILLTDPSEEYTIILRLTGKFNSTVDCTKFNDCEFQKTQEQFIFSNSDFDVLNSKHSIYISKTGGLDYFWDSQNYAHVIPADIKLGNSYDVFWLNIYNRLQTEMNLENNITVQIAFQIDKAEGLGKLNQIKSDLNLIINTLNW